MNTFRRNKRRRHAVQATRKHTIEALKNYINTPTDLASMKNATQALKSMTHVLTNTTSYGERAYGE